MAANVNALRTFLREQIGFGLNQLGTDRANAVIDEGLSSIEELIDIADDKGIENLCYNVRKPSGNIPQPNWMAPEPNPQNLQAPLIPKPGHSIPAVCEQRLQLAAYGASIYHSIGRDINTGMLNRERLREFKKHQDMVENHTEPETLPDLSKTFTIQKFLDQFPTYLRELLGSSKVALSYIIRENDPPAQLPPLEVNVPWMEDFNNLMDELIEYTPHSGPAFNSDNARVYNLLVNHLAGTNAIASTARHQRNRNGRGAYFDLVMHHLSSAKWERTVELAEKVLNERKWNGRNARYPLKIHIAKHREAFNDLSRASEQITYDPPNETSRVRHLLSSIETSDPTICAAKTTIKADRVKNNDFEEAADFLIVTAPHPKVGNHNRQNHNVSGVNSKGNRGKTKGRRNDNNYKRGKVSTGPKTGVEIRFYQPREWHKLTQDERDECIEIRKKETVKRKQDNQNDDDEPSKKIAALQTQIEEMKNHLVSVMSSFSSSNASTNLPPYTDSSNSLNSALRPPRFSQRE